MKHLLFFCAIMLAIAISATAQDKYAIEDVSVIPMNKEGILEHQTVLIGNGKIEQITASSKAKIPAGYKKIPGAGKYLIPGLMDMHAHFYNEQGDQVNTNEPELKMMLANGVTTARIMAGHPNYLTARENVRTKTWTGPDLVVASPQMMGRQAPPGEFNNYEVVSTKEKAAAAVKKAKQDGYDAIKITTDVSPECYQAIITTAKAEGIKVVGHVGPKVKLPAALAAGQQIEHMDEFIDMLLPDTSYNHGESVSDVNVWRKRAWNTVPFLDETKIAGLAKRVKQSGVYVTPTNFFFISFFGEGRTEEQIKQQGGYDYIPSVIKAEYWKNRQHYIDLAFPDESRKKYVRIRKQMVNDLWKAGVPLMAGSDAPGFFLVTGFMMHYELETFVSAGLTPWAALQTATVNPARFLEINKGTVETGKIADLLLLDKNPLSNIGNTRSINGIFKGGVWYDDEMRMKMLEEAKVLGN